MALHLEEPSAACDSNLDRSASSFAPCPRIIELDDDTTLRPCIASNTTRTEKHAVPGRVHRSKRKTKCPLCSLELLEKTLPRHMRTKHPETDSWPTCLTCGKPFKRKDLLERHEREMHNNQDHTVLCDICGTRVRVRYLPEHRQTQKCKAARNTVDWLVVSKAKEKTPASWLHSRPSAMSMFDPLVVAASLHRSTLLEWWATESRCESSQAYNPSTSQSLTTMMELQLSGTLFPQSCDELPEEGTYIVPEEQTSDRRIIELPSWSLAEVWKLRDQALNETRRMLEFQAVTDSMGSADDTIIQVSLVKSADDFIFGKDSSEHMINCNGLSQLLASAQPTEKFIPRFEGLLEHTWRERRGQRVPYQRRFFSCESVACKFAPTNHRYYEDLSQPRKGFADKLRSQASDFWNNFVPGVWGVWRSCKFGSLSVAKTKREIKEKNFRTTTDRFSKSLCR